MYNYTQTAHVTCQVIYCDLKKNYILIIFVKSHTYLTSKIGTSNGTYIYIFFKVNYAVGV